MQFEPIARAEHIKLDLFPAKILSTTEEPTVLHAAIRIVVTDSHYYVFREGGTGPEVAESGPISAFEGDNTSGWTIEAPESPESQNFVVHRDANCGCGSRLRGFHPFPGVPMARYIPPGYEGRF